MIGDLAGDALGGIARFMGRVLMEVIFEMLIKGTGYAVLKVLRWGRTPGEMESCAVGLLIWVGAIGAGLWWLFRSGS